MGFHVSLGECIPGVPTVWMHHCLLPEAGQRWFLLKSLALDAAGHGELRARFLSFGNLCNCGVGRTGIKQKHKFVVALWLQVCIQPCQLQGSCEQLSLWACGIAI